MNKRIRKAEKNLGKAYDELRMAKNAEIIERSKLLDAREYFIKKLGGKCCLYKINQSGNIHRFDEVWHSIRKMAIVCANGQDHYGDVFMCLTTEEKYNEAVRIAKEFIDLFCKEHKGL